ncbi:hypothetical protein SARC_12140, partial [Sphaeroforma arctica JP610]
MMIDLTGDFPQEDSRFDWQRINHNLLEVILIRYTVPFKLNELVFIDVLVVNNTRQIQGRMHSFHMDRKDGFGCDWDNTNLTDEGDFLIDADAHDAQVMMNLHDACMCCVYFTSKT